MKKLHNFSVVLLVTVALMTGCAAKTKRPADVPVPPAPICPLPDSFKLDVATQQGWDTVRECPDRFNDVFVRLLELAADNDPAPKNRLALEDWAWRLADEGLASRRRAEILVRRFLNFHYVTVGDVASYELTEAAVRRIKADLATERAEKQLGLLRASVDQTAWQKAEANYERALSLVDRLYLVVNARREEIR